MEPRVLFEDDWLLVIDKPAGLAVHGGAGQTRTLDDWIGEYLGPRAVRNDFRASAAHRLDRGTSGVLVCAKRRPAMQALMSRFAGHRIERTYLALVRGKLAEHSGRIEAPVVDDRGRELPASTRWTVRDAYRWATFVECLPDTGRKHQIRKHFAGIGSPIAGDQQYGEATFNAFAAASWELDRMFLHASRLAFPHPKDGSQLDVEAPLPPALDRVLMHLRGSPPDRFGPPPF